MSCTLGKFETYGASKVGFDVANQSYRVELAKPIATCPEGIFFSKKAQLVVTPGAQATLAYNNKLNRPVITVPSKEFVFNFNEPETLGFGSLFFGALLVFGVLAIAYRLFKFFSSWNTATEPEPVRSKIYDETYDFQEHASRSGLARARLRANNPQAYNTPPTAAHNTNDNLLTGVLLGHMLSGHNDVHTTHTSVGTIVESTEPVQTWAQRSDSEEASFSSDDSGSGSSYSSDSSSSDSYSSDSSSSSSDSYSSDSSSSYDSGSSFSSDSGGGFDSGGSFGSDS